MPRLLVVDNDNCVIKLTTTGSMTTFPYGTFALVFRSTLLPTGIHPVQALWVMGNDTHDEEWDLGATGSSPPSAFFSDGQTFGRSDPSAASTITAGKWYQFAWTKATGSVVPRFHRFDFATATWVHEAGSAAQPDDSTTIPQVGTGYDFGGGSAAYIPDGDFAAVGCWKSRAMTDSEVERLPAGSWERYAPDLYVGFPSGRDSPTSVNVDAGRNRMRVTTNGSAVTRSASAGPPGFRYSAVYRRR